MRKQNSDVTDSRRAVGYIRVSTSQQSDEGISLDAQRARIEAMATAQGGELIQMISDDVSGKSLDRPGIQAILAAARAKEIDMVIVYKLDRLTRSVVDLHAIVSEFNKRNVSLISLSEALDTGSASGRMVMNLLTVVSQWERETIGERTAFALRHKRSENRVFNHTPYGYRRVDDKLEPIPEQIQTIRLISELREREPYNSLRDIAEELNKREIKPTHGRKWGHTSINKILKTREFYQKDL
jgi:DNA invertase Pin-like site-specific DNA recombinase